MEEREFLGRGVSFPVEADWKTGRLKCAEEEESIRQAIHLILMTRKGERITRPEFGCAIWEHVFGTTDFPALSQMEQAAEEALIRWEPRISNLVIHAYPGEGDQLVLVEIRYRVRSTNNPFNLVYPFYLEEGMERL